MASKLYNSITKLEESIETEKASQTRAKSSLNRLATERQTHQAVVSDRNRTSDEIDQARAELKRVEDEIKQADKEFRDCTSTLVQLIQEKEQAGAELRQLLETDTDKDALAGELNELKSAFAQMTLDKGGPAQPQTTDQGTLQELVQLLRADKTGAGPVPATPPPTTTPNRTKSLATMPSLTKAAGYTEHLTKLKTFFRLNKVVTEQNKKDLLVLSLAPEVAVRAQEPS